MTIVPSDCGAFYYINEAKLGEGDEAVVYRGGSSGDGVELAVKVQHVWPEPGVPVPGACIPPHEGLALPLRANWIAFGPCYGSVFELCAGSLLDAAEKAQFSDELCARVINAVVRAVKHMHDSGYVHGDLKLENVFVSWSGEIKVGDFGSSRIRGDSKHFASTYACPADYVPSEWHDGCEHHVNGFDTTKLDIYGIGVMSWQLAGANDKVSPSCAEFVRRCTLEDWSQRPTADELLASEWLTMHRVADGTSAAAPFAGMMPARGAVKTVPMPDDASGPSVPASAAAGFAVSHDIDMSIPDVDVGSDPSALKLS